MKNLIALFARSILAGIRGENDKLTNFKLSLLLVLLAGLIFLPVLILFDLY